MSHLYIYLVITGTGFCRVPKEHSIISVSYFPFEPIRVAQRLVGQFTAFWICGAYRESYIVSNLDHNRLDGFNSWGLVLRYQRNLNRDDSLAAGRIGDLDVNRITSILCILSRPDKLALEPVAKSSRDSLRKSQFLRRLWHISIV